MVDMLMLFLCEYPFFGFLGLNIYTLEEQEQELVSGWVLSFDFYF